MYKGLIAIIASILLSACTTVVYLPGKVEGTGKNNFIFSPKARAWAAYDPQGNRVRVGKASGGVDACPEDGEDCRTVTGIFSVKRKGSSDCESQKYPLGAGGAPMPYCMHFHQGYAIHGSSDVPNFPSSHGCIRVNTDDARWLNQEFLAVGSPVIVKSY